jgi:hypothetical protein
VTNKSYLNRVRRLGDIPNFVKNAVAGIKYQQRVSALKKKGAIPLSEIRKDFEKLSWDLYRKQTEPDAGSIWTVTSIKNTNGEDEKWIVLYVDSDNKIVRNVKASIRKEKEEPLMRKIANKDEEIQIKTSRMPGTIVQIDVPHGNLYEKYNGKIGEVVAAVPDRSKVSFKDLPSTWFEDNIIRPVSLCPVCNAEMSLQMLKKLGTIKCKCGASYSKRQLEKIATENRINKVASKKTALLDERETFVRNYAREYFGVLLSTKEIESIVDRFVTEGLPYNPHTQEELVEDIASFMQERYPYKYEQWSKKDFSSIKKAQNVVQTLWVDDPKDLRHYFKSLQSPPTSPAKEPSKEEPEDLEEVDLESEGEGTEKEASIKKEADGMEALRGGGGAGSDKLTPMNWTIQESKTPRLPEKLEEEKEPETEEEEVEEITITVNPDSKAVSVDFGKGEEEAEEETPELKGAEAPVEGEGLETEELEEEEGSMGGEEKPKPETPVVF